MLIGKMSKETPFIVYVKGHTKVYATSKEEAEKQIKGKTLTELRAVAFTEEEFQTGPIEPELMQEINSNAISTEEYGEVIQKDKLIEILKRG